MGKRKIIIGSFLGALVLGMPYIAIARGFDPSNGNDSTNNENFVSPAPQQITGDGNTEFNQKISEQVVGGSSAIYPFNSQQTFYQQDLNKIGLSELVVVGITVHSYPAQNNSLAQIIITENFTGGQYQFVKYNPPVGTYLPISGFNQGLNSAVQKNLSGARVYLFFNSPSIANINYKYTLRFSDGSSRTYN